jgi:hypothetical protein
VVASLEASGAEIVEYDYQVETKFSTGLTANKDAARFEAIDVQTQKIAVVLTSRLNEDQAKIVPDSAPAQDQQ